MTLKDLQDEKESLLKEFEKAKAGVNAVAGAIQHTEELIRREQEFLKKNETVSTNEGGI